MGCNTRKVVAKSQQLSAWSRTCAVSSLVVARLICSSAMRMCDNTPVTRVGLSFVSLCLDQQISWDAVFVQRECHCH